MPKISKRQVIVNLCLLFAITGAVLAWRRPVPPNTIIQQREAERTPPGMVYVPGGWYLEGTNDADADDDVKPQRRVFVPSFYIDRTEVTNAEFRRFRPSHTFPPGEEQLPVTNITYDEAEAYAKWAGKRLPTESEWEKAARGTDGRCFPWGNTWDKTRVAQRARHGEGKIENHGEHGGHGEKPSNHGGHGEHGEGNRKQGIGNRNSPIPNTAIENPTPDAQRRMPNVCALFPSRVQPVGTQRGDVSPYGCRDMAGNAYEWVQGFYNGDREKRILRGGAVGYGERAHRTYLRAIEGAGAT